MVGVDSAVEATFLKVIVHLTSSPAKTTCSCQRTKTRMLLLELVLVLPLPLLLGPSGGMVQGAEGGTVTEGSSETGSEKALDSLAERGIGRRNRQAARFSMSDKSHLAARRCAMQGAGRGGPVSWLSFKGVRGQQVGREPGDRQHPGPVVTCTWQATLTPDSYPLVPFSRRNDIQLFCRVYTEHS